MLTRINRIKLGYIGEWIQRKHKPKSQITTGKSNMKIWVVMAKVEELQARGVERVFDSIEKAKQYSEDQYKNEIRHFVNIGGIDRSIEEWEVE
ncbi:MAG: hypothetical protein WAL46_07900 [Nitrososphaeraceae archaeon]